MGRLAKSRNVDATIAGAEAGVAYQLTDQIQADISAMYAWGENTTDHTLYRKLHH
jgi:iron complex outermembrane receptor protein